MICLCNVDFEREDGICNCVVVLYWYFIFGVCLIFLGIGINGREKGGWNFLIFFVVFFLRKEVDGWCLMGCIVILLFNLFGVLGNY